MGGGGLSLRNRPETKNTEGKYGVMCFTNLKEARNWARMFAHKSATQKLQVYECEGETELPMEGLSNCELPKILKGIVNHLPFSTFPDGTMMFQRIRLVGQALYTKDESEV